MDRLSFQEAILADYIQSISSLTRDQLLNELLDVKLKQLETLPDQKLTVELNEQRIKQRN